MSATPNVTRAWKYARRVVNRQIVAGRYVQLACEWMLDDLDKSKKKAFPWLFDKERAERVLHLCHQFHHVKGEWALRGEKIHLEDWQCFFVAMIFGWINRESGYRRFIEALLFVARKNAKTTIAAVIGLIMLTDDNEFGSEVYSGATSEKQAWEVFGTALEMAKKNPDFQEYYGVEPHASNISVQQTNSKFEPLIGKPGDGPNPHCAIHDEFHEHKTDEQVDSMKTGMGSRRQPLQLVITTAGSDTTGPCAQLVDDAQKNVEGILRDDRSFPLLYCRDIGDEEQEIKGDEWDSVAAMKKANPNLGVSVHREFLDHQLSKARENPDKQTTYRTKHGNEFVGARHAYFNMYKWNKSADPGIKIMDFAEFPAIFALDLASKVDLAAFEILFVLGKNEYCRFGKYYLPEATLKEGENKYYKTWADQGWITVTDGHLIDFEFIKKDVLEFQEKLRMHELAYDPYQATMLITQLINRGLVCVEMPPQVRYFSEPMKTMQGLINGMNIKHDGDPVYKWMLSNVTAKKDAKDNVYPRKERDENKIDGPVATIMTIGRAMSGHALNQFSFIDDPLVLAY